jgi:hypothetical protein
MFPTCKILATADMTLDLLCLKFASFGSTLSSIIQVTPKYSYGLQIMNNDILTKMHTLKPCISLKHSNNLSYKIYGGKAKVKN